MDITHMLTELRIERQQLDEAILVLQRLATSGGGKRRGRGRPFSAATRKRMAAAQRKRWAARKANAS